MRCKVDLHVYSGMGSWRRGWGGGAGGGVGMRIGLPQSHSDAAKDRQSGP